MPLYDSDETQDYKSDTTFCSDEYDSDTNEQKKERQKIRSICIINHIFKFRKEILYICNN